MGRRPAKQEQAKYKANSPRARAGKIPILYIVMNWVMDVVYSKLSKNGKTIELKLFLIKEFIFYVFLWNFLTILYDLYYVNIIWKHV